MKRLLWSVSGGVILLLIGLGAVGWLTATESGFRWLTSELSGLSQGALKIEGVDGHLFSSQLAVRKLEITSDTTRIRVEHARLDWQPAALLTRQVNIRQLTAQRIEVETLKPSTEPVTLPDSLRLPFGLTFGATRIDLAQLELKEAGQTMRFSAIRLNLDGTDGNWKLNLDSFITPWASLRGRVSIGQDAPFVLSGHVDAAHSEMLPVNVALDVQGRLEAVRFNLEVQPVPSDAKPAGKQDGASQDMKLHASGEVAPFADILLPRMLVAGQGIDPAQWVEGAPTARLAFSGAFEEQAGKRLLGTFSLHNARAGKLETGGLPLVEMSGAILGDIRQVDLSALKIDLGEAGKLTGDGQWRDGQFALNLLTERLNLAGLHGSLYASRIRADFKLSGNADRLRLQVDLGGHYGQGQFAMTYGDGQLTLDTLDLTGLHGGHASAQGSLKLDDTQRFTAKFDLTNINPARFGAFPQARLNARGQFTGALTPDFNVQGHFELPPGDLEGRPVSGKGKLRFAAGRLSDTEVDVNLAGNQIQLRGDYQPSSMRLDWLVRAPELDRLSRLGLRYLGVELAGRLESEGSVSGHPERPTIKLDARASGLLLPGGVAADKLELHLDMQASANGAFNGELLGRGLKLDGYTVSSARVGVQGRRAAHTLALDVQLSNTDPSSSLPGWHLIARAQGGLDEAQVWRGQLLAADLQGAWPIRLLAPATLRLGKDGQRIDAAAFSVAGGRVTLAGLEHQAGRLTTRGSLHQLPVAPFLALLEQPPPVSTDLLLDGEWDIKLADALNGHIRIRRQSGGVRFLDSGMTPGLNQLKLEVQAVENLVTARLDIATTETGRLHAEGRTTLAHEAGQLVLRRSAPLAWTAQANLPDLRSVRAFLPQGMKLDAQLALDLSGAGTLAAPELNGTLRATGIRLSMPEEGLNIRDGRIGLTLDNTMVKITEGVLEGQSGRLLLTGEASWRNPAGGLALNFDKFSLLTRSDRRLWLSGTTRLGYAGGRMTLDGDLRVDKARFEMPEASRPRLSDDVVVVGQPSRGDAKTQHTAFDLNLGLDLGDDFLFKGAGLDARLGGKIRVFTRNEALRGEGSIQVKKGRYAAYGQVLDIERGVLNFTGPISNPNLDILAVRKTGSVTAGVKVSGTVERPVASLYSDPAMPDTEKLSWLVFGHGLEKGDSAKFEMMQVMAGALLSQAESVSLQTSLADALSIDSFDVRGGDNPEDLSTTVVSVGKRLNSQLMMSYEQSLDGLEQVVKAIYQFSPHIRLEASTGSSTGLDVFYTIEYD